MRLRLLAAITGIAVAGGTIGAYVVASPGGGEEEIAQQEVTVTPDASATPLVEVPAASPEAPTTCPQPSPPAGGELWRWGDVTVATVETTEIQIIRDRWSDGQTGYPAISVFTSREFESGVHLHAFTGLLLSDDSRVEDRALLQPVLATISVCPFEPTSAPWPYTGEPPSSPRSTWGKISFLQPDPAAGVKAGRAHGDPGGDFVTVQSARSTMGINADTGEALWELATIDPIDKEAFERYVASVELVGQQ